MQVPSFPTSFVKQAAFFPLYVLQSGKNWMVYFLLHNLGVMKGVPEGSPSKTNKQNVLSSLIKIIPASFTFLFLIIFSFFYPSSFPFFLLSFMWNIAFLKSVLF
jgi:hypothetical protein